MKLTFIESYNILYINKKPFVKWKSSPKQTVIKLIEIKIIKKNFITPYLFYVSILLFACPKAI